VSDRRQRLSPEQKQDIRDKRKQGKTWGQLAYLFKISRRYAWRIVMGR
jgi:hypothetical protein